MFLRILFASLAPDGIVLCGRRKNTRRKRVPKNAILSVLYVLQGNFSVGRVCNLQMLRRSHVCLLANAGKNECRCS